MISLTENQINILTVLAHDPEGEIHFGELARRVGKKAGVIQKALDSLETQGFVMSRRRGNQRLVSVNAKHPLAHELRSIVEKISGAAPALRAIMGKISDVRSAFIFGSYAKGGYGSSSDIDVVIVGNTRSEPAVLKAVQILEKKLGREINYKWYTPQEFKKCRLSGDPFFEEILGEKYIILKGRI